MVVKVKIFITAFIMLIGFNLAAQPDSPFHPGFETIPDGVEWTKYDTISVDCFCYERRADDTTSVFSWENYVYISKRLELYLSLAASAYYTKPYELSTDYYITDSRWIDEVYGCYIMTPAMYYHPSDYDR